MSTLPDIRRFEAALRDDPPTLFDPTGADLVVTRAPGRLDVMGGIADYSGSLVLEMPLAEATRVALQPSDDGTITVRSRPSVSDEAAAAAELDANAAPDREQVARFTLADLPHDPDDARAFFQRDSETQWAAYVVGTLIMLRHERGLTPAGGYRLLIESDVPQGAGVSSSAALEVASMRAFAAMHDLALEPRDLAILCQEVENHIVGAPCGVMDQMTSACGEQDQLLRLLCQPAELHGTLPIPDGLGVWGIDSGIQHAVSGSDYGAVRTGTFMGRKMIQTWSPAALPDGYLANLDPATFERRFGEHLPERMRGADFLEQFGSHDDSVTEVDPDTEYAVRAPTEHAVYEADRVRWFTEGFRQPAAEDRSRGMGGLMFESHDSYSACGLGSPGTDALVAMVRRAGPDAGLYGAKITGGGSGGTVAILGRADADEAVQHIAAAYKREHPEGGYLFRGSSPGAGAFGVRRVRLG